MRRIVLLAASIVAPLALSACKYETGKPLTGLSSSAPAAVSSAAGGTTGGGDNRFTKQQVTPGTPAGANLGLKSPVSGQ